MNFNVIYYTVQNTVIICYIFTFLRNKILFTKYRHLKYLFKLQTFTDHWKKKKNWLGFKFVLLLYYNNVTKSLVINVIHYFTHFR